MDNGFNQKVKSITVVPVAVGKNQYTNIDALVAGAYMTARREMPTPKKFTVFTYLKFPSQKGGDDFETRTNKFNQADYNKMLAELMEKRKTYCRATVKYY
jgi:hypothetical protein